MPRGIDTSRDPARRPGWRERGTGMTINNRPVTHVREDVHGDTHGTIGYGYVVGASAGRYGAHAATESEGGRVLDATAQGTRTYRTPYRAQVVADQLMRNIDQS